ncbi:MAG: hypothetical protein XU14_C0023G0017 [Armatimonadetes bacterium CSP1-3]|nr:MAG: hypothetical protein XU14_C0023G0017 [Armatimonadetes bacterium CSP1-3]
MQNPRLAALILLILAALAAGCSRSAPTSAPAQRPRPAEGPARQVEIQVQGTAGVRFEGSLGEPGAIRTITGTVPAQFRLQVRENVYVRVQKAAREGKIVVRVRMDGREVASRSTDKPFGLVTVVYPPAR